MATYEDLQYFQALVSTISRSSILSHRQLLYRTQDTYPVTTVFNHIRASIRFLAKVAVPRSSTDSILVLDNDKVGHRGIVQGLL